MSTETIRIIAHDADDALTAPAFARVKTFVPPALRRQYAWIVSVHDGHLTSNRAPAGAIEGAERDCSTCGDRVVITFGG